MVASRLPDHLSRLPPMFWDGAYALFGLVVVRLAETGGAGAFFERDRDAFMALAPVFNGMES
jgi:hypothetical protein